MITRWETVRIFISSTFEDMHAERDYLVKQVFPELREWCEQRKLNLDFTTRTQTLTELTGVLLDVADVIELKLHLFEWQPGNVH